MRKSLVMLFGLLILIVTHHAIYSRERLITEGDIVLLRLAPVDPRSLMQGDYMALRFSVAVDLRKALLNEDLADGHVVLKLDEKGIGSFTRIDDGSPLQDNERRMRYRLRAGKIKFGTNAFFFEEGTADFYSRARYGEFRVDTDGVAILTHMRGEGLQRLQPGSPG